MSLIDYFRDDKKDTASIARERLQIIVAHERGQRAELDYLPEMQEEIIAVIRKYVAIEKEQVEVQVDQSGSCSVLELNVILSTE